MPSFSLPDNSADNNSNNSDATAQGPTAAVAKIIAQAAGITPEELLPEMRLAEDLGIDSLEAIALAVRLEQESGKPVDESIAQGFHTVGDVYAFVEGS